MAVLTLLYVVAGTVGLVSLMGIFFLLHYWNTSEPTTDFEKYFVINDARLKKKFAKRKIPIQLLHDAFFDQRVDAKADLLEILHHRTEFSTFHITPLHVRFVLTRFIPETLLHTRKQDERQISEHYNRGNDFFEWFLGERMIYTSGLFTDPAGTETLEEAQDRKCKVVCDKLHMRPNLRLLDIGCGWGTFIRYAARHFSADATGVTLSIQGKNYHDLLLSSQPSSIGKGSAKVLHLDYRDIPKTQKFDRITCIEMAEHVGVKNFQGFMRQIYNLLEDDGLFFLQIAGLRRASQFEDIVWGLFMDRYIFCGADASTPLGFTVNELEKAGFEIHSVENIGIHYSLTINKWYNNWVHNREKIVQKYGERNYRIWLWFLAWCVIIAKQGSSTCWQIILNKNKNGFDRKQWVSETRI